MKTKPINPLMEAMSFLSPRHEHAGRRAKYAKLTGHIKNPLDRRIVECLCEQQLMHMNKMRSGSGPADLNEATLNADVAIFQKYAMKVIPRVYPQLFIKDLVSIQPIPLPTAKVFFKDFLRDPSGTYLHQLANFSRSYANRTTELTAPAKIKMALTATDVSATSKALNYEFSVELNQDFQAYHGISADPEIGAEAALEIQREIEADVVQKLLDEAGAGNVNWSTTPPVNDTKTIDIEAYNRTFFHAIVDARTLVYKQRYTYPNWLVTGPDVCARIEKLPGFTYDPSIVPYVGGTGTVNVKLLQGRQLYGTLNGIIAIYVDPWFPVTNKCVLGYKGTTDFDVGLVYSPYIPFYSTEAFENPSTLGISRSLLSRQAITMLVPEMYSTLTLVSS